MGFRQVYIQNPAHLSLKNRQLIIEQKERQDSLPIEDLDSVVIENHQSTATVAVLNSLAGQCSVFICDTQHMPSAVLTGFPRHSRQLRRVQLQLNISKPLQKQLWQRIVRQKIVNQSHTLLKYEQCSALELLELSHLVKTGDSENLEAVAALKYFLRLFGPGFSRELACPTNAGLNYGYAIIRGSIARKLASLGFLPAVGIFHHSQLNEFNLADDFIEPFRPLVDKVVRANIRDDSDFGTAEKGMLISLLNDRVVMSEQQYRVTDAIHQMLESFLQCLERNNSDLLVLPKLIDED